MITTFEKVLTFRQNAVRYKTPYAGKFSPFLHSIERMMGRTKAIQQAWDELVAEIDQKHAEMKDGFFVRDDKDRYKFKAENEKKRNEEIKKALQLTFYKDDAKGEMAIEIEPYIVPEISEGVFDRLPKDIDFSWWEVLSPFVLPEINDAILEKLYERDKKK